LFYIEIDDLNYFELIVDAIKVLLEIYLA